MAQTTEVATEKILTIDSMEKQIRKGKLRLDYNAQRQFRWPLKMKSELVSTILQNLPFQHPIFAEMVNPNETSTIYVVDGKQKISTILDYKLDKFKVSKKAKRCVIKYQSYEGNWETFDIGNKSYSQLPEELKDRFNDYTVKATQYLSCDKDDIDYHLYRYNQGVKLSPSELGIIEIGEERAGYVNEILTLDFFSPDYDNFTKTERKNGTVSRVVIESLMAIKLLDQWKSNPEELCRILRENTTKDDYDELEKLMSRLEDCLTDKARELFTSKLAFLWITLFDKFSKLSEDDENFVKFMEDFTDKYASTVYEDESWIDHLAKYRNNRDVAIVKWRLDYLTRTMMSVLGLENAPQTAPESEVDDFVGEVANDLSDLDLFANRDDLDELTENIVEEFGSSDEAKEDIIFVAECLNDLTESVDSENYLLNANNLPSLMRAVKTLMDEEELDDNIFVRWLNEHESSFDFTATSKVNDFVDSYKEYVSFAIDELAASFAA